MEQISRSLVITKRTILRATLLNSHNARIKKSGIPESWQAAYIEKEDHLYYVGAWEFKVKHRKHSEKELRKIILGIMSRYSDADLVREIEFFYYDQYQTQFNDKKVVVKFNTDKAEDFEYHCFNVSNHIRMVLIGTKWVIKLKSRP